jgi:long-chain acyl-CoA synthetase
MSLSRSASVSPLAAGTVCEALQAIARQRPAAVALRNRGEAGVTWAEYAARVARVTGGLASLGVTSGDTVALMLTNRPEFHIVDMAAVHLGAVPFSVYNSSPAEQVGQRLERAGCRVIVTESAFLDTVREAARGYGRLKHVVAVDGPAAGVDTLAEVAACRPPGFDFESSWRSVSPDDLVTLIFTSGTTGPPKAAQLTHRGVMGTLRALDQVIPLPRKDMVSFLPMAHIAERMFTHYMPLAYGARTTCCPDRAEMPVCLAEVHPDVPLLVPRIWAKLREAIEGRIGALTGGTQRATIERTIALGRRRVQAEQAGAPVAAGLIEQHNQGKALIRELVLAPLGLDCIQAAFVGSAPTPPELVEFFQAVGVPLLEAYGLTEATGFAAVFPSLHDFRIGTAGRALPGVELRLAADGEILLRSEMNMAGYRGDPERTREVIDPEGWLHTGDIGELDPDGYLKIVDRKKDLIINSYGKNMSPALIEETIRRETPLIDQVVAIGDGRDYNVALVTLAETAVADAGSPIAELAEAPSVVAEVEAAIERANSHLSRVEQVRRFTILPEQWRPDSELLTPTLKLKRKAIARTYAVEIDALYADVQPIPPSARTTLAW